MNVKVSIIIPIYKVEPYIERCIKSVLNQTYRNLEVILVDDCSPDLSMQLAREHIEQSPLSKDLLFIYLKHDHNRGLSAARNTGIDAATGDYVFFLDSDDEITPDCISDLVEPLKDCLYDFVIGDYETDKSDNIFPKLLIEGKFEGVRNISNAFIQDKWYCMAWNKLCKVTFLKEKKLYFKEGLIHEDVLWSSLMSFTANSMYSKKKITYRYLIRGNSITTSENVAHKIHYALNILKSIYEYQENNKLFLEEIESLENKMKGMILYLMSQHYYSPYQKYQILRMCDVRSWKTKNKMYKSIKDKIRSLDVFLPVFLGYVYKKSEQCILNKFTTLL